MLWGIVDIQKGSRLQKIHHNKKGNLHSVWMSRGVPVCLPVIVRVSVRRIV